MLRARIILSGLLAVVVLPALLGAQTGDLRLLDWRPKSMMVVKQTEVLRPKFPVIDIHNHLRRLNQMENYLEQMDQAGVWKVVSLDGLSKNDFYKQHLTAAKKVSKDRFIVFFNPDFSNIEEPGWGQREAAKLERAVKEGCRGMKIFKELGLGFRDSTGALIKVDDPRIDPVWAKCGELGIPVMIHVSDPKAFFTPLDEHNERYDELGAHPAGHFTATSGPRRKRFWQRATGYSPAIRTQSSSERTWVPFPRNSIPLPTGSMSIPTSTLISTPGFPNWAVSRARRASFCFATRTA